MNRRRFVKTAAMVGAGTAVATLLPLRAPGTGNKEDLAGSAKKLPEAETPGPSLRPPVRIPEISIRMRSPDSALVGVSHSDVIEIKLADVLKFHGYCAAGVAFSFRVAQEAFKALYGTDLPLRQNLKVQTSIHCCQAGALAYITGARTDFGAIPNRGDLVLLPEEMKKIIFIDKIGGQKITVRPLFNPHGIFSPLFQKVRKEPDFAPQVQKALHEAVQQYIYGPAEKLFKLEPDEKAG